MSETSCLFRDSNFSTLGKSSVTGGTVDAVGGVGGGAVGGPDFKNFHFPISRLLGRLSLSPSISESRIVASTRISCGDLEFQRAFLF